MEAVLAKLEAITARLEKVEAGIAGGAAAAPAAGGASAGASGDGSSSPSVQAFDDFLNANLPPFTAAAAKLGGAVQAQAAVAEKAFQRLRDILVIASKSKKPAQADLQKILGPLSEAMAEAGKNKDNRSPDFNQLAAIAEGLAAMSWVIIEPTPAPFVTENIGSADFYGNKVRVAFKGKDDSQIAVVNTFKTLLQELAGYVKKHHTTGLVWNAKGGDAVAAMGSSSGGPPAPPAPPAAPPAPPAAPPAPAGGATASGGASMGDVLAQINKGNVTSGLKKVTADMQNHKTGGAKSSVVPAKAATPAKKAAPQYGKAVVKRDPVTVLDGKKWKIEHHDGNKSIVIDDTNPKQAIYAFNCKNSVIQIKGKVNHITLDACVKTAVVFDDSVAGLELVSCKSVEVQVNGKVLSISIDKSSGACLYLLDADTAVNAEIISSSSSEINVNVPKGDETVEIALPEQFISKWDAEKKTYNTGPVEHV